MRKSSPGARILYVEAFLNKIVSYDDFEQYPVVMHFITRICYDYKDVFTTSIKITEIADWIV